METSFHIVDYSQGKMESNPVTTAKSTTGDSSSPSPVDIFDGNSSLQKKKNTPVTTAEATNGDFLFPVVRADKRLKMEKTPVNEATSGNFSWPWVDSDSSVMEE
ncbi:unnamed protein product, partial [Ilex paraguariensis]